jgi:hypothetical protein
MRLGFFDPLRDEIAATATDLITRFGLRAHDEASYLAELSAQMRSRRHKVLYELVAHEIDASFVEARRRLSLRQSASNTARTGVPLSEGHEAGGHRARDGTELPKPDQPAPRIPSVSRAADIPTSLVAELNLVDINPSPRRRFGSR